MGMEFKFLIPITLLFLLLEWAAYRSERRFPPSNHDLD